MYKVIRFEKPMKYSETLKLQKKAHEMVRNKVYKGILMILEHEHVFTVGTSGGFENFNITDDTIRQLEIDVVKVRRGGNVTYHGPGQVVAYPIFDLNELKKDTHWFIDSLEYVAINVLKDYSIQGSRKSQYRGVWIKNEKICAIGVAIKKWVTYHGLALNVNVNRDYFDMINPCGITEFDVTSLNDFGFNETLENVVYKTIKSFESVFKIELTKADVTILGSVADYDDKKF